MFGLKLTKQGVWLVLAILMQLTGGVTHCSGGLFSSGVSSSSSIGISLLLVGYSFIHSDFYQSLSIYSMQTGKSVGQTENRHSVLLLHSTPEIFGEEVTLHLSGKQMPDLLMSYGVMVKSLSASSHQASVQLMVNSPAILALQGDPEAPGILFAAFKEPTIHDETLPEKLFEEKSLNLSAHGQIGRQYQQSVDSDDYNESRSPLVSVESFQHQTLGVIVDTDDSGYIVLIIYSIDDQGNIQTSTVATQIHEYTAEGGLLLSSLDGYTNVTLLRREQRALLVKATMDSADAFVVEADDDIEYLARRLGPPPGGKITEALNVDNLLGCIRRGKFYRGVDGLVYCNIPGIQQAMMGGSGASDGGGGNSGNAGSSGILAAADTANKNQENAASPRQERTGETKEETSSEESNASRQDNSSPEQIESGATKNEPVDAQLKDEAEHSEEHEEPKETPVTQPVIRPSVLNVQPLSINTASRRFHGNGFARPHGMPNLNRVRGFPVIHNVQQQWPQQPVFHLPPPATLWMVNGAYFIGTLSGFSQPIPVVPSDNRLLFLPSEPLYDPNSQQWFRIIPVVGGVVHEFLVPVHIQNPVVNQGFGNGVPFFGNMNQPVLLQNHNSMMYPGPQRLVSNPVIHPTVYARPRSNLIRGNPAGRGHSELTVLPPVEPGVGVTVPPSVPLVQPRGEAEGVTREVMVRDREVTARERVVTVTETSRLGTTRVQQTTREVGAKEVVTREVHSETGRQLSSETRTRNYQSRSVATRTDPSKTRKPGTNRKPWKDRVEALERANKFREAQNELQKVIRDSGETDFEAMRALVWNMLHQKIDSEEVKKLIHKWRSDLNITRSQFKELMSFLNSRKAERIRRHHGGYIE